LTAVFQCDRGRFAVVKLYALPSLYRHGNFARVGIYENDVATLLHYYQPDVSMLFAELAKYADEA